MNRRSKILTYNSCETPTAFRKRLDYIASKWTCSDKEKEENKRVMMKYFWLAKQPKQKKYVDKEYTHYDRYGYNGKYTNSLCLKCGKCSHHQYYCCGTTTVQIGYKARAPKINANKKQWKKFCKIFKIDYNKLEFLW